MKRLIPQLILAALAGAGLSHTTQADDALRGYFGYGGYGGYGFDWFGHGNNGPAAYALGNIPAPPYFALHPPVYYSHPTAHTYGRSPFACACGASPAAHRAAPRVTVNRHLELKQPAAENANRAAQAAPAPMRLANPYYQSKPARESELASRD